MGFLANAAVRAILVMLILAVYYMEMHHPGPRLLPLLYRLWQRYCISCLCLLLAGRQYACVGVAVLHSRSSVDCARDFVVPGFGVTGISGIIAVVMALVGGMLTNDAVTGFDFSSLCNSLIIVGVGSLLAVGAIVYLTSSHGPKVFRKHTGIDDRVARRRWFRRRGYVTGAIYRTNWRNCDRYEPGGKIEIGNTVFDAVSTGPFIAAKKQVKVTKYENAQLYVSEV